MISRLRYYDLWLRLIAYTLPVLAFLSAFYIRFGLSALGWRGEYRLLDYLYLLVFTTVLWAVFADRYKVSSIENLLWERTGLKAAASACLATFAIEVVVLFFIHSVTLSRAFFAMNAVTLLALTLLMRFAFRRIVGYHEDQSRPLHLMVVGVDSFARRVCRRLRRIRLTNARVTAYVRLTGQPIEVSDAPVYELDQIDQINSSDVDDIVLAVPLERIADAFANVSTLRAVGKPIRAVMDFGGDLSIREKLFQFGTLQMIDMVTSPAESLPYLVFKRVFDILFSSLVILTLSPLLLVIALAIKVGSAGPVFFRQERVGLNGRLFYMYKFRTMSVAPVSETDTLWTKKDDRRRTTVGSLLRKTSLDELPQFFNVLRGEMSVVGPRPERPYFVRRFLKDVSYYNDRHRLKVGITGWAQINGWRGDTSIEKRLECDLYYLQNWSLWFDFRIIAKTLWVGMVNKNAY
ncbi:MAG: exopolysaccharide biosynthesis polyprenyl glycosylphosphotransferase [Acidobacteriaceae bacterium]